MFIAIKSELPKWKILLNWICGVEMSDGSSVQTTLQVRMRNRGINAKFVILSNFSANQKVAPGGGR